MQAIDPAKHGGTARGADTTLLDRKMQGTRAALTGCYLVIGCLALRAGAVGGPAAAVLAAISLMPLSGGLLLVLLRRPRPHAAAITAGCLIMDTVVASLVVHWTGGALSPCLPFYLTPVMAAAFRFGPRGSLLFSALAVAGYAAACAATAPGATAPDPAAAAVLRIVILFAAPAVGIGALHRKLGRYRREKALRRELERANRQMETAFRERKAAQEQLLHAEKLSSLGRLVAGVAHEINNPISFVVGNLVHLEQYVKRLEALLRFYDGLRLEHGHERARDALKEEMEYDYLLEDARKALADSRDGAQRVCRIVDALRKFSRLKTGTFRKVELREVLENAWCILAGKAGRNTHLVREYAEQACALGDPDELNQLFLNLLSNAVDALPPEGGTIRVRTFAAPHPAAEGPVHAEVEDDGPGIPDENRDRIFEPFFTTKEVGRGTGLGLSIAYGIARRHRGEISVARPAGGGALFRVTLPRWNAG